MKTNIILLGFLFLNCFLFGQDTLILQPGPESGIDAHINSYYSNNNNQYHEYFKIYAWTMSGTPALGRTLFKFDLNELPSGITIINSYLDLYGNHYGSGQTLFCHSSLSGPNNGLIKKVVEPWDESTVTWNNQPAITDEGQIELESSHFDTQDYLDIDVTDLILQMYEDPASNFGFRIQLKYEEYYRALCFLTSDFEEPELRPRLTIIYESCDKPVAGWECLVEDKFVQFTDTSNSSQQWFWDFGDGYSSSLQNPQHTYIENGFYEVCLTVTDSCGQDTFCDIVEICDALNVSYSYSVIDKEVTFKDSLLNATSFWWEFGDGFFSNIEDPVHVYNDYGTYYVCLQASNECYDSVFCDSVRIINTAGLPDIFRQDVEIYPNPSSGLFMISAKNNLSFENAFIIVCNLHGQMIMRKNISTQFEDEIIIDLSGYKDGIYFITIAGINMNYFGKLIKK